MAVVALVVGAGAVMAQSAKDLDAGAAAMDRKDYPAAEKFFSDYVTKHPKALTAMLMLGMTRIELKNFDGAIDTFSTLLNIWPDDWHAHIGLVQAYARKGDWKDFDKERALLKAARDSNARGIQLVGDGDVIDVLTVAGQQYTVKSYYKPVGPHQTHYVFLHIVDDANLKEFLTCDSDDGDQVEFKRLHPKEAAAGARSFSLDPWEVVNNEPVHGHVYRFYDGEPTYEELRADVLKVLNMTYQTTPAPEKR
jgi:tetratricopeptide (TPR) repeat protein